MSPYIGSVLEWGMQLVFESFLCAVAAPCILLLPNPPLFLYSILVINIARLADPLFLLVIWMCWLVMNV